MINRDDVITSVKKMVKERGTKWSVGHVYAINEILDLIDKDFLDGIEEKTKQLYKEAEQYRTEAYLGHQDIKQKEKKIEKIVDDSLDTRATQALAFALRLSDLYATMDTDVMECVSYGVWAYLGGGVSKPEGNNAIQ